MAIISTITAQIGNITAASAAGVLAPVVGLFKAVQFVPVLLAVAVLWGMTIKPPDNQSWSLGDYAAILPISWVIANSGRSISGLVTRKVVGVLN